MTCFDDIEMRDAMAGIMAESLKNSKIPQLDSDGRYYCMDVYASFSVDSQINCVNLFVL